MFLACSVNVDARFNDARLLLDKFRLNLPIKLPKITTRTILTVPVDSQNKKAIQVDSYFHFADWRRRRYWSFIGVVVSLDSQSLSWRISEQLEMPFWWPLIVLAFAYAICKFLLMLIPPNVPSIDVDASDGIFPSLSVPAPTFVYGFARLFQYCVFICMNSP